MKLTPEQMHAYFEARLGRALPTGKNIAVRCPFHQDKSPSLSIDATKGLWHCHAGCGSGGVLEFEKQFSSCDEQIAWANVAEVCGLPNQALFRGQPEAIYSYTDEGNCELFQKIRNPGKRFSTRAKDPTGKWVYSLEGVRKVLYKLFELVTANLVFICEGEKDCDKVKSAISEIMAEKYPHTRFACTTNFDGAGKWRAEYSPQLTGKHTVIFQDNDELGRAHAQAVANAVSLYARSVRVVDLPGLPAKGDVSDYLSMHTAAELLAEVEKAPQWKPGVPEIIISAPRFLSTASPDIEWTVDKIIQRGANGFFGAFPKVGKSWAAIDLAIALALGLPWFGFDVPRSVRTALITREDTPNLTRWRMERLLRGRGRERYELEGKLFVNSREQSPSFKLDRPESFGPMLDSLKQFKSEFVILDVLNVMHSAEENDNTEMARVMEQLNVLRREVGCDLGVCHHFSKNGEGSSTQRLRGAGAIAGWAEWVVGIEKVPNDTRTRRMEFELKAGDHAPLFYEIKSNEADTASMIERVEVPEGKSRSGSRAEALLQ